MYIYFVYRERKRHPVLPECHTFRFGRGDKNRTRISGFGDRCTAIVTLSGKVVLVHQLHCAQP